MLVLIRLFFISLFDRNGVYLGLIDKLFAKIQIIGLHLVSQSIVDRILLIEGVAIIKYLFYVLIEICHCLIKIAPYLPLDCLEIHRFLYNLKIIRHTLPLGVDRVAEGP